MKQPPLRTPTDPCEHCGEPVGRFDWVVNGAGQLCHYPACFLAIYRATGIAPTPTTADP